MAEQKGIGGKRKGPLSPLIVMVRGPMARTLPPQGGKAVSPSISCKILLRHARTRMYYQNVARWTSKAIEAFDFMKVEQAVRFAGDSGLEAVEVVMYYGDGRGELTLPVANME